MEQPEGRSQFGVLPSEMTPFSSPGAGPRAHPLQQQHAQPPPPPLAEAASPINSRPPPPMGFNELAPAVGTGNFPVDDEALVAAAGEEAERGGSTANRWPRQETLALLKIRSDMDATFRDATLKGPLWEDVSRKLAELGYQRSAKKCKEKFENVHKYYKRTKEGRAGRQDGKSYRFFSELEALHSGGAATAGSAPVLSAASAPVPISFSAPMAAGQSFSRMQPIPISSVPPPPVTAAQTNLIGRPHGITGSAAVAVGLSLSDNSSSSSFDSDNEGTEGAGGSRDDGGRKRKRGGGSGSRTGRKMMTFFEGLMRQMMERQEAMQQRFLDTIEKREQDRMIQEEAWRRQELVRLNHEKELLAQERTMAANRDNALISYFQKITGKTIPIPTVGNISVVTTLAPQTPHVPPPPLQGQQRPQPSHQQNAQQMAPITVQPLQQHPPAPSQPKQQNHEAQQNHHDADIVRHQPSATELVGGAESQDAGGMVSFEPMSPSSRWPKAEVHALIRLRSGLDSRYQEAGPKGPLWEEISAGMKSLGYSRSAKRCKEKWENINKYFKKVKESNKKRPEDARTCPYFHQLDALYRKKHVKDNAGAGNGSSNGTNTVGLPQQGQEPNPSTSVQKEQAPQQTQQLSPSEGEKNGNNSGAGSSNSNVNGDKGGRNSESGGVQALNSNGVLPSSSFFEEGVKKPEDIMKELMKQRHSQNMMDDYVDKLDDDDNDTMEQDDDCDDDDDEDDDESRKMQYKIQFQRPNVNSAGGGSGSKSSSTAAAAAAGSFMAMVK